MDTPTPLATTTWHHTGYNPLTPPYPLTAHFASTHSLITHITPPMYCCYLLLSAHNLHCILPHLHSTHLLHSTDRPLLPTHIYSLTCQLQHVNRLQPLLGTSPRSTHHHSPFTILLLLILAYKFPPASHVTPTLPTTHFLLPTYSQLLTAADATRCPT